MLSKSYDVDLAISLIVVMEESAYETDSTV